MRAQISAVLSEGGERPARLRSACDRFAIGGPDDVVMALTGAIHQGENVITRTPLKDARLLARGVLAISMLAAGLTGCGSSSQGGASATTAVSSAAAQSELLSSAAPSSPAAEEASAPGTSPHAIDVCATLPAASAAELSGEAITTADATTESQPQEYGCAYSNDDDLLQVQVRVFEHDAATTYDLGLSVTANASIVSGLGDKAFFDNDGTMYVLAGSNLIQVNGLATADQCAALARPILAAL